MRVTTKKTALLSVWLLYMAAVAGRLQIFYKALGGFHYTVLSGRKSNSLSGLLVERAWGTRADDDNIYTR